jgi:aromatic ring hydroxylase
MTQKSYLDNLKEHRLLREQKPKMPCAEEVEESENIEEIADTYDRAERIDKQAAIRSGQHQTGGSIAGKAASIAARMAAYALQRKKWDEEAKSAKARGERS